MELLRLSGFVSRLVCLDEESATEVVSHDLHNFLNALKQETMATMGTNCSVRLTDCHIINVAKIDPADLFADCANFFREGGH
jgi:hypothetical protein